MTDYLTRVCPNCGGRLCVNSSDPDRVYCDTCEYEENQCHASIAGIGVGIGVAMSRLLDERAMERTRLILKADSLRRLCGFVRAPVKPVFYLNSEAVALLQADLATKPSDEPCNELCGIPFRVVHSPDAPDIALSLEYGIKEQA